MATVTFEKATRIYPGNDEPSVDQLDLKVEDGESLVLVDPSGYGKSTSLRILAGLEDVSGGHIFIGDRDVTNVPPENRDIAMIFQDYALYPHMTVRENTGSALKITGAPKEETAEHVEETTRILDLGPYLDCKPRALSGGQCRRVMIGRAIVRKPQVFLMDEPLPNLDAKLRAQTRIQITPLRHQLGATTVYVTHDQTEAFTMGDRVTVLKGGLLQQVGSSRGIYECPASEFVAGLIDSPAMNPDKFKVKSSTAVLGPARIPFSAATVNALTVEDKGMITIGFHPEGLELVSETGANSIPIQVDFVEEFGSSALVYGHLAGTDEQGIGSAEEGSSKQLIVHVSPRTAPTRGGVVYTRIIVGQQHNFSASTGMRLPE